MALLQRACTLKSQMHCRVLRTSFKKTANQNNLAKLFSTNDITKGNGQPGADYHLIIKLAHHRGLDCRSETSEHYLILYASKQKALY